MKFDLLRLLVTSLMILVCWVASENNARGQLSRKEDLPDPKLLFGPDGDSQAAHAAPPAAVAERQVNPEVDERGEVAEADGERNAPADQDAGQAWSVDDSSSEGPATALESEAAPPEFKPAAEADAAEEPVEQREDEAARPLGKKKFSKGLLIDVQGPIFGRFHWYLNQRLDMARESGCDLVIVRLTSPGGLVDESVDLSTRLTEIDWATTIVWIPKEAISGGAVISLGAERIYMKEGALVGDAGPIRFDGGGQFVHAEEKFVSYLATAVSRLAKARRRPAPLAEAMVDRKLIVWEAIDRANGTRVFLKQSETELEENKQKYKLVAPVPETLEERFLTLQAERALELGMADAVFDSEESMLASLDVAEFSRTELTWIDKTVYLLNSPWITGLLLVAGLVGLYIELVAPGISVAGLTALLCFGVFFWSHMLGGTAGWLEIMMFVLGVVCVLCEIFVLPGFGVFGISGIGLLVLSLMMATQGFVVPESESQWDQFQSNLLVVLGSILGVLVLVFVQVFLLDSVPGLNKFKLAAPVEEGVLVGASTGTLLHTAERHAHFEVGTRGVAESDLRPSGKVLIDQTLVDVITEGDYVEAGTPVEVIRAEGNRIIVRRT